MEREFVSVEGLGVEAAADWEHLGTPETYLGHARGAPPASADRLPLNHWAFTGEWTVGPESVALDQAGGSIVYRFHARDAHLVLSPGAREPIPSACSTTARLRGRHTAWMSTRTATACSRDGRLYQLVREHNAVRERTLEIIFLEPGAEAYAFTFG